jgi:aspartyl-tRNA(Asn)/glutamyl-tRNA(Gln) amidotransferase subunit A
MTDLHWLTASQAARAFADKSLSPVELVRHLIQRAGTLDPKLHAYIRIDPEGALDAAAAAEKEIAQGRIRGPLHGVPVGVKDIFDVATLPTTCHSHVLVDNVAATDAVSIQKLRQAGAVIMGKLSTHEFAIGGPSFDLPFPPARNPWNPDYHPGGSSSGSGSGVCAGLFPVALGSDTGGSVRNPASACGVVGIKPTYGLVSRRGVFPLSFTLDHVGPLTRTVADAALMLDAIAGHDPADPGSSATQARHFGRLLDRGVRDLRVGFVRHFHETDMPAHPEVTAGLEEVARVLQAEGAEVRTIRLPTLNEFSGINRVILCSEAWSIHAPWLRERPGAYGQLSRRRLLPGAFMTAGDYVGAQRRRLELIAAVEDALRDVDVLLCASSMDPSSRMDDPVETARTYPRQARSPFNVTGHPALAMMAGLSSNGLPISVQFVGRYFDDATVLRVAAAYERATPWHDKHPPIG